MHATILIINDLFPDINRLFLFSFQNTGKQFLGKKNFKAKDNFKAKENTKKKFAQTAKQFGGKGGAVSQFQKSGGSPKGKKGNQGNNKQNGRGDFSQAPKFGGSPKGKKGNKNANKMETQFPKFGGNFKGKKEHQGIAKQEGKNAVQIGKKRPFEKGTKMDNKKANMKTNGTAVPFQGALGKKNEKMKPQIIQKPKKPKKGTAPTKSSDEDEDEDESLDEEDVLQMMEAFDVSVSQVFSGFLRVVDISALAF